MAKMGRYRIPREMKDEDKWFKFFNSNQLLWIVIFGVMAFVVYIPFKIIHLEIIGMVLSVVLIGMGILLPRLDMPADKYLWGGGMTLKTLAIRILTKLVVKERRVLYISNSKQEEQV